MPTTTLDGVSVLGDGTVADMVWSRPAITICGIDCPPVLGSAAAMAPRASARLNLRVPPGVPAGDAARTLVSHLHAVAPWGVHVEADIEAPGIWIPGQDRRARLPGHRRGHAEAYGRPMVTLGEGGGIPLCNVLAGLYPDAELILLGVEEPLARIHAPNESVDPAEVAAMALTEALFLQRYASARR
jgi:cysteinylglycine-S-conjugate dipeptidase